jgi:multidrug efflux pump subunit AcrB
LPGVWVDPGNGQAYYVVTFYDPARMGGKNEISQAPVRIDASGAAVQLGTYAKTYREVGPVQIERNRLMRSAHVLMQVEGRDLGSVAADLTARLQTDKRTHGIEYRFVGQVELMQSTFSGLGGAVGLAIMVVFMIMASQFKSIRLPFIMLFTIPVTLFGIALALAAAGQGFTIPALMGVLMVIGISVSNGILLVDAAAARMRDQKAPPFQAIVEAARSRFVPIAMTSLATVIGLIPTALGLEAGTASNQPLALAVVGGLTSSTLLSLFLVPTMFLTLAGRMSAAHPESEEDLAETHPVTA